MSMKASGRRIVALTGGTSGIGRATVEALLERGVDVVFVGRDRGKCENAERRFVHRFPDAVVEAVVADLSTTEAVRGAAARIREFAARRGATRLDALVNNAAAVATWRIVTAEGYERQFAVNHLAPFLLSLELAPILEGGRPGRVIVVSSGSHRRTRMNWGDPMFTRGYTLLRAYRQSKLANVLFCAEFNRRFSAQSTVRAYAFDPGLVRTDIGSKESQGIERLVWTLRSRSREAADPSVPAAALADLAAGVDLPSPQEFYRLRDRPGVPDRAAVDRIAGSRLWALSQQLCAVASRKAS